MFSQACVILFTRGGGGVRPRRQRGVSGIEGVWYRSGEYVIEDECLPRGCSARQPQQLAVENILQKSTQEGHLPLRDGHCRRRYASYWNASLL